MTRISYPPEKKDKFILSTNNSLNDVVNIPTATKPVKCKNRIGYWRVKL